MFNFFRILKGLLITNEIDPTKRAIIQVSPSSTTGTTSTYSILQTQNVSMDVQLGAVAGIAKVTTTYLIDQELQNTFTNIPASGTVGVSGAIGQSFTTSGAFSFSSVDIFLRRLFNPTNLIHVDICADSAGIPGSILASSTAVVANTIPASPTTGFFYTWNFSSPVSLLAATKYHIVLRYADDTGYGGANNIRVYYQNTDVLAGGNFETFDGATWTSFATFDMAFRLGTGNSTLTASPLNLASDVTGTLPIANGGTGQTTASAALNALLPQPLVTDTFLYTNGSSVLWNTANLGINSLRGVLGNNNLTNPDTQFDFSVDLNISAANPSSNNIYVDNGSGSFTNDITLAGPIANGRDQAGAFPPNSFIHFYIIQGSGPLQTISSLESRPQFVTLPGGFTKLAYVGAIRTDGSGNLFRCHIKGSWVYYDTVQTIASGLNSTSETLVSLLNYTPQYNATWYGMLLTINPKITSDGSGNAVYTLRLRGVSGKDTFQYPVELHGISATTVVQLGATELVYSSLVPLTSPTNKIYYLFDVTSGTSQSTDLLIRGYQVPNGDT